MPPNSKLFAYSGDKAHMIRVKHRPKKRVIFLPADRGAESMSRRAFRDQAARKFRRRAHFAKIALSRTSANGISKT